MTDHEEFVDVSFDELEVRTRNATIRKITEIQPKVFSISLDLHQPMKYYPGQYILVEYMINNKRHVRAYTMISSPLNENTIELNIQQTDDPVTSQIITNMQVGDQLEIRGPYGRFVWNPTEIPQKVTMIAINIGINPFISMLRYIEEKKIRTKIGLIYYWEQGPLLFQNELNRLQEKIDLTWQQVYNLGKYFTNHQEIDTDIVFLCGEKRISNPLLVLFEENNIITEEKIRLEQWF